MRVAAVAREGVHDPAAAQALAALAAKHVVRAVWTLSQAAAGVAVLPGASLERCQPLSELTQLVAHATLVSALAVESLWLHGYGGGGAGLSLGHLDRAAHDFGAVVGAQVLAPVADDSASLSSRGRLWLPRQQQEDRYCQLQQNDAPHLA